MPETLPTTFSQVPSLSTDIFRDQKVVFFIFIALLIGSFMREIYKKVRIPFTPLIILCGILIGKYQGFMGLLGTSAAAFYRIKPRLILMVFAPTLAFDAAYSVDWYTFKRSFISIFILACPGVLIATVLHAFVLQSILGYPESDFSWYGSLAFGAMVSALDPAATSAILKEMGGSVQFKTLLDGEAMLNNGFSLVLFTIFYQLMSGHIENSNLAVLYFVRATIGGPLLGAALGLVACWWLRRVIRDDVLTISVMILSSYILFFVCEYTWLQFSGFLALTVLGLLMANVGKTQIYAESSLAVQTIFGFGSNAVATVLFLLIGVYIGIFLFQNDEITPKDWTNLVFLYVLLHVVRILILAVLSPILSNFGYEMTKQEIFVLAFGGLRGPLAVTMALVIYFDPTQSIRTRQLFLFFMTGIASMTNLFNGSTLRLVVHMMKFVKQPVAKTKILNSKLEELKVFSAKYIDNSKLKSSIQVADWDNVVKQAGEQIFCRKIQETSKRIQSFQKENIHNYQQDTKSELRFRVLRHMKVVYWQKFQKGEASADGIKILEEACNLRLEDTNTPINSLWEVVESNFLNFGSIKFWYSLKEMIFCGTIARGYISRHLLFVLETSTIFIEAMNHSRELVSNVDIEEEIKRSILNEIDEETDKAELKLIELSEQFSEIISSIETKRVATLILNRQKNRALEMSKSGFIDEQDYENIRREIDQYFSKIQNQEPKWKLPDVNMNFVGQPVFSCLPQDVVDRIAREARTIIKQANTTIYQPGATPEYLYIVSKGTVEERIEGENPRVIKRGIGSILCSGFITKDQQTMTRAETKTDVILSAVPAQDIEQFLEDPKFRDRLIISCLYYFTSSQRAGILREKKENELRKILNYNDCLVKQIETNAIFEMPNGGFLLFGGVFYNDRQKAYADSCYIPHGSTKYTATCQCTVIEFQRRIFADNKADSIKDNQQFKE